MRKRGSVISARVLLALQLVPALQLLPVPRASAGNSSGERGGSVRYGRRFALAGTWGGTLERSGVKKQPLSLTLERKAGNGFTGVLQIGSGAEAESYTVRGHLDAADRLRMTLTGKDGASAELRVRADRSAESLEGRLLVKKPAGGSLSGKVQLFRRRERPEASTPGAPPSR